MAGRTLASPTKRATNGCRRAIDFVRTTELLDPAAIEDGDAIGKSQRLALVMRHIDKRSADLAMDPAEFPFHLQPDGEIERRQRLVEQQHLRPATSTRANATRCICPPESS